MVGEMRDLETISLALTAAETGHLVFATLHTTSAALTPDRIVDVFPPNQQTQIRLQLADSLQGIMAQMLLPRQDNKGMVLVQEVLVATDAIRALIRERKTPQILNMMQTGAKEGMKTLEAGLNDLVHRGVIPFELAASKANFPRQIQRKGK
jgi:twitching motility protein PilT